MPAFLKRPSVWIAVLIVLALGSTGFFLLHQAKEKKAKEAVAAAHAPDTPYAAIANGKADVEGGIINVAARTAGILRSVDVQEGDRVRKGQILASLDDDEAKLAAGTARADLAQAHAQVASIEVQQATAKREYARLEKLAGANFVARQQLDQTQDAIATADAQLGLQKAAIAAAQARLAQAQYNDELTMIRAPADGVIVRRYANPGSGASTLNVSNMFDLEPDTRHIVRAEISEGAIPAVTLGQTVELVPEADQSKIYVGQVLRRAAVFGARKLQSDDPTEATDARVVEVVVSADGAPFLIGQRVLVKFMKPGHAAGGKATK